MKTTIQFDGLLIDEYQPDPALIQDKYGISHRPPILAVHGMWGSSRRWQNYGNFFAANGYPFFAVNLRGHSDSRPVKNLGHVAIDHYVQDVKDAIAYVSTSIPHDSLDSPILFGHSMGGLVAQRVAETVPLVGLVILNSAPPHGIKVFRPLQVKYWKLLFVQGKYYLRFAKNWRAFKPTFTDACRFIINGMPSKMRRQCYDEFNLESGRAAMEIVSGCITVDALAIQCPILVVGCGKDMITPLYLAEDLFEKYRVNDKADLKIFSDFAHWIQVEPNWQHPAEEILKWLDEKI